MADGAHPVPPVVSVVVPARDAAGTLPACLDALAAQDLDRPYEVVVVDNGSLDGTAELAERHPVVDRVVRRERGGGPSAARNDGVRAARSDTIAFTDSDCVPEPDWLREGLAVAADLVQGAVSPPEGARVGPFDRTLWVSGEHGLYETANLFVRREWFDRAGGFVDFVDPGRERPFGEDAWFGWRARRAGARTAFAPRALVRHAVFPRGARDHIAEMSRVRLFCELVRRVPELRGAFLHRGVFLTARSERFDAAVAGAALSAASGRRLPLLLALPYLLEARREARRWPGHAWPALAAVRLAADVVMLVSLVAGSARTRTPVL